MLKSFNSFWYEDWFILVRKIAIIKKSTFFIIGNNKSLKNIFFKIVNIYLNTKFIVIANFYLYKCKIESIIFMIIICNNKYKIGNFTIYCIIIN